VDVELVACAFLPLLTTFDILTQRTFANVKISLLEIPKQQQESKDTPEQGPSVDQLDDPFQEVDWSLFMDDIGWGTGDPVFMGLP
jgi:hypothetical protein